MRKVISFITGTLIFSALPLIGWGVKDLHGYFLSPARITFLCMMIISTLLVIIFVPDEGRSRGEGKKMQKQHKISLFFLQIISLLVVIFAPFLDRRGLAVWNENEILRFTGLLLLSCGFSLMNWAVINLDKQFSTDVTLQDGHKLITKGAFRFVRHPRYLGIIIFLAGISMTFRSWVGLGLMVASVFVLIWRIRDEEKLMKEEFGKEWDEYKKKTYSLIPYIY